MMKKHLIYKKDKWNMLTVEVQGTRIIVIEISDQWGEENHTFLSRPALMNWVEQRFSKERFKGTPEELDEIWQAFQEV